MVEMTKSKYGGATAAAAIVAILSFALAAAGSPAFAQNPPTPTPTPAPLSVPDEFGGRIQRCGPVVGGGFGDPHWLHQCVGGHSHGGWGDDPHRHTAPAVSAAGIYQPTETLPPPDLYIDAPLDFGERVCGEVDSRPSADKRGELWDVLNCEVRRSAEALVAVAFGVSLLGVAWGGIHMITAGAESGEKRTQGRRILWASITGLVVALFCYLIVSLLDLGVSAPIPWDMAAR